MVRGISNRIVLACKPQAIRIKPPSNWTGKGTCQTADVCRKHGISGATFYKWKAKFDGLDVSDARRLKALEDENGKLKKLLAETMLDIAILKDINSRKW